jgi:MFS family permease
VAADGIALEVALTAVDRRTEQRDDFGDVRTDTIVLSQDRKSPDADASTSAYPASLNVIDSPGTSQNPDRDIVRRAKESTMAQRQPERLSANRDFNLLWGGQAASEMGAQISVFVFPLIVMAMTGSAELAGGAAAAGAAARMIAGLPAGALADRWNRKAVMLWCEAARLVAMVSVAVAIAADALSVSHIFAVAVVEGACAAMFLPAEQASLTLIVRPEQLSSAVARNTARSFLATLIGPALAGVLLGVGRLVPFLTNAGVYLISFASLLFLRVPAPAEPSPRTSLATLPKDISAGVMWLWRRGPIRTMILLAIGFNLIFQSVYLVAILSAQRDGVPAGEIGVIGAFLGAGGVAGAVVAPRLHSLLRPYVSMAALMWACAALTPLLAVVSGGYAVGGVVAAMAFLAPTVTTTVMATLMTETPNALQGRMTSTVAVTVGAAGALGLLTGGFAVARTTGPGASFACAVAMGLLALIATFSRSLRRFDAVPGKTDEHTNAPTP